MEILQLDESPLSWLPFLSAASGGQRTESRVLPLLNATVDALPKGLEGVFVTSDLQGYEITDEEGSTRRLVGHALAEFLEKWCEAEGFSYRDFGVILAGDLFAYPDLQRRGGLGDVDEVWGAFATRFRWVVGVGGNHDLFMGEPDVTGALSDWSNAHALDGDVVGVDTLRVAGISGVIGRSCKPWRRSPKSWQKMAESLLSKSPDFLVLHQGPDVPQGIEESSSRRDGDQRVRETLEAEQACPLVICGHRHWSFPLARLSNGAQVLNVDSRVVLLRA